jgi:hypothetical protein
MSSFSVDAAAAAAAAAPPPEPDWAAELAAQAPLRFEEDSPFARRAQSDADGRAARLGARLGAVAGAAQQCARAGDAFADACAQLSAAVQGRWADTGAAVGAVSAASVFERLGDALATTEQVLRHLAHALGALLGAHLAAFVRERVAPVRESHALVAAATAEYEAALQRALEVREGGGGGEGGGLFRRRARQSEAEAAEAAAAEAAAAAEQLANLRRRCELLRFDHARAANALYTEHVYEAIDSASAAVAAIITFFREGEHAAQPFRAELEEANALLARRRLVVGDAARRRAQSELRDKLERGLSAPDFVFADAFPEAKRGGGGGGCDREGFLFKQSSSLKRDWKRRWFALSDGVLRYHRDAADLEPQPIVNVLTCSVRPRFASDMKNSFEIITPSGRVYALAADSPREMQAWVAALQACVERLLSASPAPAAAAAAAEAAAAARSGSEAAVAAVRAANPTCADCDAPNPEWASINLGVVLCIECSGVHRSMGVHVSKVRSLLLDSLDEGALALLGAVGNARFNAVFERNPHSSFPKPRPSAPREAREHYIHAKYEARLFLDKRALDYTQPREALAASLVAAAARDDVIHAMLFPAFGLALDAPAGGETPLFAAARAGATRVIAFLLLNGVSASVADASGRTPAQVAREAGHERAAAMLDVD